MVQNFIEDGTGDIINFDLCLDAQMTDCICWESNQDGATIEEKHGPAEVPAGDVWPNDVTLDLTNSARWLF